MLDAVSSPATTENAADLALAQAILARDRKAAAELVRRFSGPLSGYVRSRLQPRWEDVDDIVQETFLTALRGMSGYHGAAPLKSWLLGIARHKVEDHYRARLRATPLPEDAAGTLPAEDPALDMQLDRKQARRRTAEILSALPEHYRIVLLWRYWEQRSAADMAAGTGRTVKSVERLLARARAEFGERWEAQS